MASIRKYTLSKADSGKWNLTADQSKRVVHSFTKKENATKRDVLRRLLGKEGGSVKIEKEDGRFQEERTYSRKKDPRKSRG